MKFIQIQWQSDWYRSELELRLELLRKPLGFDFSESDLAAEQSQGRYGIVDDDELIACVLAVFQSPTQTKLRQMAVLPARQRQGVGAMLMQNVEAVLKEQDVQTIVLHARKVAVGFYEKLGYHCEGDEFVEVSIPHFKMTKTL